MTALTRRELHARALGSLVTFSLLETLCTLDLFGSEVKPITVQWLKQVHQLGLDVQGQNLEQTDWQRQIEELFSKVELDELLRFVDFEKLTARLQLVDNGARSLQFRFQEAEGVPQKVSFGKQIFALKKDRSVVPHGHNNMTTAFLILKGEFHGRHFDRLEDQPEHLIIKPTIDRKFKAGDCSSISDDKDNIHWFQATSETAFIFNIHVLDVRPGSREASGRVYLDPQGEKLAGGKIRAPRLDHFEVHKRYG